MDKYLDTVTLGDCNELMRNLPDASVDLVIADPPYNLSKGGSWKWDGSSSLPGMGGPWSKAMESWDSLGIGEYFEFTLTWLAEIKRVLKPEGSAWIFGTYHNSGIVNVACQLLEIEIINEVVWYKRNSFPNLSGRRLTASHETITWCHVGQPGKRRYFFDYEESRMGDFSYDSLKAPGKQMRTVWDISNNKERRELAFGKHPTQKPLRLLKRLISLSSTEGDVVFTPFAGAGSECLAAKEMGRHFIGFEMEDEYVQIALERLAHAQTANQPHMRASAADGGKDAQHPLFEVGP